MLAWRDVSAVHVRPRWTKAAAVAQTLKRAACTLQTQLKFQTGAAAESAAAGPCNRVSHVCVLDTWDLAPLHLCQSDLCVACAMIIANAF